jgi:hypothetical protein
VYKNSSAMHSSIIVNYLQVEYCQWRRNLLMLKYVGEIFLWQHESYNKIDRGPISTDKTCKSKDSKNCNFEDKKEII